MKKILAAGIICLATLMGNAQLKAGAMAPEIALPNANDSIVKLSSFKGKVVLIDFWASWCGPCRASNPSVVKLYNQLKDQGFEVFGVSIDSKKKNWTRAIKQDKIKYSQVIDLDAWNSKVAAAYGVEAIPSTFLLDQSGKIVAVDLEGKALEDRVRALLQ
jgi:peroxiredoxin